MLTNKRNVYIVMGVVIVAIVTLLFVFKGSPNTQAKETTTNQSEVTVLMKKDIFEPEVITIKKGTKVIFKNVDSIKRWPASDLHPTHGIYPEFDPLQPVEVNSDWSFIFNKVGQWKYHDHLSPYIRGIIKVSE
jgi:plastocyanin